MMTIKEQFISEIKERIALQKDLLKRAEDSARIEGSIDALQGLLNSMDSLESEKPGVDLDDETIRIEFHTIADKCFNEGIEGWQREKLIARHFAQWGAEHGGSSEIPNDLEEAAEKYGEEHQVEYYSDAYNIHTSKQDLVDAVIYGAKTQKEEMLKGAVDAMVTTNLANRPVIYLDQLEGLKYGDKVRVIVIKDNNPKFE